MGRWTHPKVIPYLGALFLWNITTYTPKKKHDNGTTTVWRWLYLLFKRMDSVFSRTTNESPSQEWKFSSTTFRNIDIARFFLSPCSPATSQHSSADLQILRKQDVVDIGQFTATHGFHHFRLPNVYRGVMWWTHAKAAGRSPFFWHCATPWRNRIAISEKNS